MQTNALAIEAPNSPLRSRRIIRRDLRPDDVDIRVTHCGVCHSDLHAIHAASEQGEPLPLVPGHEFTGEVVAVGSAVSAFSPGDPVAVGNIVDSCGACAMCRRGQENFCKESPTLTYGGQDRTDSAPTLGAYAQRYVARDRFVYRRPANLDPAAVAPLMCAGVTVWEPLRAACVGAGTRLGVAGIGGLGHLAIKLGRALGAEVTAFTTSSAKAADAERLGASRVVVSTSPDAMDAAEGSLDVILDTVAAKHELTPYLRTLDLDGTMYLLGHLGPISLSAMDLLIGRKRLAAAGSGGHRLTQDLLDFCGEHDVAADVEVVPAQSANEALTRLARNDVRYRFVLDLAGLEAPRDADDG